MFIGVYIEMLPAIFAIILRRFGEVIVISLEWRHSVLDEDTRRRSVGTDGPEGDIS